ncbi:laminin subunit beta-4 [Pitangus sulphuratus]|nr:laminin subunit beta-4 [Pitangus sulphuratus]
MTMGEELREAAVVVHSQTPHMSQAEQKCFLCDSRYPYNPYTQHNSHMIENVITTFEPDRKKKWWQSENGIDHVSIRLDLETLFQFSHLILTFKVVLKALDPSFEIENPYVPYIQELITLTNLRINFTKLHTLGDALLGRGHSDPLEKYYYAIYEMVVQGSCFCNGHASQCDSVQNLRGDVFHQSGMVQGRCICHHNTEGLSCERCKDFYNDAPWRPAEGTEDNACKRCNCNGHSSRCHFDMAVYQASGGVSGGVCEDCQDNTTGQHCDQCKRFFYQDPLKVISDPQACLPCDCDPEGTLHNDACQSRTDPTLGMVAGQCPCKENVEGVRCDKCRANYYGLSGTDPLGCQPCNCDPSGSLPFSICDPATGECLCQRFTTGQRCEKCLVRTQVGYWGLGNSLNGCSPCDCDIGGSQNNLCSPKDGQCKCLPNIVSRQCNEPAPGYFFLPLDYYIYEAEHAKLLSGSAPLVQPSTLPRCDIYFQKQGYEFMIENGKIVLNRNKKRTVRKSGLEQGVMQFGQDSVSVVFRQPSAGRSVTWTGPGFARVPSGAGLRFAINNVPFAMDFAITIRYEPELGLIPRIGSVENLCSEKDLDEYQKYHCIEIASEVGPHVLPEACARLIASMSARIHNGAVACKCNPQGSLNANCSKLGGQCQCKANVVGRCCDTCSAGSYGFGFHGCYVCECHPQGSLSTLCDQVTGQCSCRREVDGQRCSRCLAGYFGFPHCRPCRCNGNAELCDPLTGACLECRGFTAGSHCERCMDGYYGNPLEGEPCRPCMCPGVPTSNRYFAHSCYQDSQSAQLVCNCLEGYAGNQCDECPTGFYKNPSSPELDCAPCPCNNNIDLTDPESCNRVTGECTKCLHNTHGANCQFCKPGYFGSALNQNCQTCECNPEGTRQPQCDKATGACNCRAGVTGRFCDQCGRGFEKDFPSCRQCHLCFDQWDTETAALAQTVQGLMRFAAKLEDKGGRMPSCDMRFKAFEDAFSEIERILRHPVLSLDALSGIREFQGYLQQKAAQMDPLHSLPYEFPDLNKNLEDIGEEADSVYELLQQKIHLHQSFQYLNFKEAISNIRKHFEVSLLAEQRTRGTIPIVRYSEYTRNHMLDILDHEVLKASNVLQQLKMIKNPDIQSLNEKVESIRKMAEDSKLKGSRLTGQLQTARNQIEVDGEITKEFIQKVKEFLLDESAPPEDIEKVANYVLQINLPLTSEELTRMLGKIKSITNHCEESQLNNKGNIKTEDAQTLLVEAQEADKAAKAVLPVDEINNKLKNVVKSQGYSKNAIIKLNEEIQGIRTQISQAENQVNKTNDELNDLSAKQTEMEDEIATWQAKTLRNKNQATKAKAEAEAAHKRAQSTDNEFADIKRKYTILQEKLKAQGPPKVTLEKVKQLKEEAEKLAEETEKKIKRITDLEKKLQELNQTKQDKAEQLRQLEEQVIAIKNEIMEQESKYATCKS